ncbi:MAG: hypothetical protein WC565_06680 [Parcubacteria group bacterium]|jgi:hypothetical protein
MGRNQEALRLASSNPTAAFDLLLGQDIRTAGKAQDFLQDKIKSWDKGDSEDLSALARGYKGHYKELMSAAAALAKKGIIDLKGNAVTKKAAQVELSPEVQAIIADLPTIARKLILVSKQDESRLMFVLGTLVTNLAGVVGSFPELVKEAQLLNLAGLKIMRGRNKV